MCIPSLPLPGPGFENLNASISGRQSPRAFCAGTLWAGPWIFLYKNLNASIPGRQSSACFPCSGAGPAFRLSLACLCCRRNLVTERRWKAVQQLTGLPANVLVALADFPGTPLCGACVPAVLPGLAAIAGPAESAAGRPASRCHNLPINFSYMPVLKGRMGKIKLFPTTEYSSKQPSDPVVPLVPCTGIFLGPSKSGKTVALISLILEQYRGVFERIYIFSPSVNIDDGWIPVKKYIEEDLEVNTEREQTYWDEWDEAALRRIIQQQRKITEASKKLEMKKLYQVLVVIDDFADTPQLHKPHGALDTLFIRGRHTQISTWVSSQKLRLISAAVRVNMQFLCCWRLRNQHELDAVIEELSALLPKEQLHRLYEQATREPYSFLFVYYLKPKNEMFYKRFEERFALEKDCDGGSAQLPGPEAVRQLHADQREV